MKVYFYLQDSLPCLNGTGPNNRLYSNVRAYLDAGCEVEVVWIKANPDLTLVPEPSLKGVKWAQVDANGVMRGSASLLDRAAHFVGWPLERSLNYLYRTRPLIRRVVLEREAASPGSIHHFEYVSTASAAVHLSGLKTVWSVHDIESNFMAGHLAMRREVVGREPRGWEKRSLRTTRRAEQLCARRFPLVLCIAIHEREFFRKEWGAAGAELLPMAMPDETPPARTRGWLEDGKLRMFHLGRIDSLPSFRSLQFLLGQVYPRLSEAELNQLEMVVMGEIRESERARTILRLAQRYPGVKMVGFQEDIRGEYGRADLQVVGSTEATGLRTRIIESFVYGVPVLSTRIGAEGIEGLVDGENILLADDAEAYANRLRDLLKEPSRLSGLAEAGQVVYAKLHSRRAVAARLKALLSEHLTGNQ